MNNNCINNMNVIAHVYWIITIWWKFGEVVRCFGDCILVWGLSSLSPSKFKDDYNLEKVILWKDLTWPTVLNFGCGQSWHLLNLLLIGLYSGFCHFPVSVKEQIIIYYCTIFFLGGEVFINCFLLKQLSPQCSKECRPL